EEFEQALKPTPKPHDHAPGSAPHSHEGDAWEPQDGLERTFWTVIANLLASIGFALVLVPAIAAWDRTRQAGHGASIRTGLLWGVAGRVCVFAWPAVGLRPELPGEASAPLA